MLRGAVWGRGGKKGAERGKGRGREMGTTGKNSGGSRTNEGQFSLHLFLSLPCVEGGLPACPRADLVRERERTGGARA